MSADRPGAAERFSTTLGLPDPGGNGWGDRRASGEPCSGTARRTPGPPGVPQVGVGAAYDWRPSAGVTPEGQPSWQAGGNGPALPGTYRGGMRNDCDVAGTGAGGQGAGHDFFQKQQCWQPPANVRAI